MLPNIAVACPADPIEAVNLLSELMDRRRPAYLRLGRAGEPVLHAPDASISIDHAIWLRQGTDVALLATGPVLGRALAAADKLAARGISASVGSFPGIRPLDAGAVIYAAGRHRALLTIEEHNIDGGFGSRVADVLIANGLAPRFGKWGVTAALLGQVGAQDWMLDRIGDIADQAAALI